MREVYPSGQGLRRDAAKKEEGPDERRPGHQNLGLGYTYRGGPRGRETKMAEEKSAPMDPASDAKRPAERGK
jgi:hypothetical protein